MVEESESVLWTLGSHASEGEDPPSDEVLEAFRAGRLPAPEARRVEAVLAQSPAAWGRLAELARLDVSRPSPELRSRVLEAFVAGQGGSRGYRWMAAAALAAALILGLGRQLLLSPGETTPPPGHTVEIAALRQERSLEGSSSAAEAYPDTPVTITASAETAAADLVYGLYRATPADDAARFVVSSLEPEGSAVEVRVYRGAVELMAPARELVGPSPGEHRLYVVVARGESLPPTLSLASGSVEGFPGHVYPLSLRLLPPPHRR